MAVRGTSDRRSDDELVDACNTGDALEARRAFEALYRRHKDFVVRVALRFVRDNDMALDVLQETFSYLLRKFPPAGDGLTLNAKLTTLLYPAARNSAITLLRKAERFAPSADQDPDDLAAPEPEESDGIAFVLSELPEQRREVMLMRFVDDMSLQDIAVALNIPLGTVKSRLHLAIRQLKDSPEAKKLLDP